MKTLFTLLLLIAVAASGIMRLTASDFKLTDGKTFSIMQLELPESDDAVNQLMASFASGTKEAVLKQLNTDYIFMAGCYPAIMVLCLIAIRHISRINLLQKDLNKKETGKGWSKLLMALAVLQLLAWGFDVWENAQLENWIDTGMADDNISLLKIRTLAKFGIGIAGFLTAVLVQLFTINLPKQLARAKLTSTLPQTRRRQYTGAVAGKPI